MSYYQVRPQVYITDRTIETGVIERGEVIDPGRVHIVRVGDFTRIVRATDVHDTIEAANRRVRVPVRRHVAKIKKELAKWESFLAQRKPINHTVYDG